MASCNFWPQFTSSDATLSGVAIIQGLSPTAAEILLEAGKSHVQIVSNKDRDGMYSLPPEMAALYEMEKKGLITIELSSRLSGQSEKKTGRFALKNLENYVTNLKLERRPVSHDPGRVLLVPAHAL